MTQFIQVFDAKERRILRMKIHPDNYISRRYLNGHFVGLTGLTYEDSNGMVSRM